MTKLPWDEPAFSKRMLREHLSQAHDGASRRTEFIERQVQWIHDVPLDRRPQRILDLGCGPGLYTQRLAALGHDCAGIDISPASIEYARSQAVGVSRAPHYVPGDVTTSPLGAGYDLAMMIHGELNVFARNEAADLLPRVRAALTPSGRMLLEVHRFAAVEAMGRRGRMWMPAAVGLFGDRPHLRFDESRWDATIAQATNLHWVIDGESRRVERLGTRTQAYSEGEYVELLRGAGFTNVRTYASLSGDEPDPNYVVLLGSS